MDVLGGERSILEQLAHTEFEFGRNGCSHEVLTETSTIGVRKLRI